MYDISVPISEYYDIVEEMRERLSSRSDVLSANWGHLIDGNLHLNIITPGKFHEDPDLKAQIEPFVFEATKRRGGSISAEHGLGLNKKDLVEKYAKGPLIVDKMKCLKRMFDPHGILNPGKYLPS